LRPSKLNDARKDEARKRRQRRPLAELVSNYDLGKRMIPQAMT